MGTDRRGIIRFTIENMVHQCRFKVRTGEKESVSQFKKILHMLQRQSYIQTLLDEEDIICSPLIEHYKLKDLIMCNLTIDLTNKYVELDTIEKNKIYSYYGEKINHLKLLLYYCYLKCRVYKRSSDDQIEVYGGKAEVAYPTFEKISKDLGITDDTIDKYNKILVALDLIRYKSAGTWYFKDDPNKIVRESVNFYALFTTEEETDSKLKEGIKFWKEMDRNANKVFTGSKEYKNNNKVLNGELGSIIKKEKLGTVTEKDIARKNEILYSINANEEQYAIQVLLDSNPNTLLSSIYSSFNSEKKAEKYYDLEESLGLLDTGEEFGVDFDYYKWVMVNYDENEHDYYMNCVNKHKKDKLGVEDIINFTEAKPKPKGLHINGKPLGKINVIEEEPEPFDDWFDDDNDTYSYELTEADIEAMQEIDALNRDQIPDDVLRMIEDMEDDNDGW